MSNTKAYKAMMAELSGNSPLPGLGIPAYVGGLYIEATQLTLSAGSSSNNFNIPGNAVALLGVSIQPKNLALVENTTLLGGAQGTLIINSETLIKDVSLLEMWNYGKRGILPFLPIARQVTSNDSAKFDIVSSASGTAQLIIYYYSQNMKNI